MQRRRNRDSKSTWIIGVAIAIGVILIFVAGLRNQGHLLNFGFSRVQSLVSGQAQSVGGGNGVNSGQLQWVKKPQSSQIYEGEDAAFVSQVTNPSGVSYQWLHNGTTIPNSNASSIGVWNAQSSDSGTYEVEAISKNGMITATAKLNVMTAMGPVRDPASAIAGAVNCPAGQLPVGLPPDARQAVVNLYHNGNNLMHVIPTGVPQQTMSWFGGPSRVGGADKCYYQLKCTHSRWYNEGTKTCVVR